MRRFSAGLAALYEILRIFRLGFDVVALDLRGRGEFLLDRSLDRTLTRFPFNLIAGF